MASDTPDSLPKKNLTTDALKKKSTKSVPTLDELTLPDEYSPLFKQSVLLRSNFYRDNYRRLMVFCILLTLAIFGVMGWIAWERTHKPIVHYYATTNTGKLLQLAPLNQPNLTTASLLNWAVEAATTAYNFNFGNYEKSLKDVKVYFTDAGYQNFVAALAAAKTLETVRAKQLVVFAVATNTPVILKEGPVDGVYAWQVQLPMLVTYQSASDQRKQNLILTMIIARRPTLESPKGIGIASITVKEV
ncbi:MAG: type IVB secretion system apparatus protein IcmL/DotI [Gammaproteobacteria bacterium]|nr:type IVB secretion system apparatus protein IcmL/DotI [Gammaproteobacteria bacterium]